MNKGFKCAVLLGVVGTMSVGLVGCGGGSAKEQVIVYNWGDYIDEDVNKMFEEETGIKVVYSQYANNEEMYAKLKAGGSNYDVVIPSEYMVERMINENLLLPLDFSLLSNYDKIDDRFKEIGRAHV